MSRVALVFPYFRTHADTELLFPPLGEALLAAHLRRRGLETRIFDGTFGTFAQLAAELVAYRPDIVGVYAMVSLTANALRVAETVRARVPQALLVAGGPLPTVFPARYTSRFHAVFRGEADLSFPRFCTDYVEKRITPASLAGFPLATYDGLYVDAPGLRVDNPAVHIPEAELAAFPLPYRGDFDHAAYQREWLARTGTKATSIILTLGCPYACDFCSKPIFGNAVRRRSLDAVFAEIAQIWELGYDSLWIADDTFTLHEPYLAEFCRRIAGLGMSWGGSLSRAGALSEATVRLMKDAGCRRVYLGLESGSPATLALMNKKITVEEGASTARLYRDAGIEVAAFFIVGYPGETVASIERTFELALSLPLDEISFTVPMPLPGSQLYERLGEPDEGKDWTHENEVTFVYPSAIDEAWLRRRVDDTMQAFATRRSAARETAMTT